MQSQSRIVQDHRLFAHLVAKFSTHPENLATESLNYILAQSTIARKAFCRMLEQTGVNFQSKLSFQTQCSDEDDCIPDLIGFDTKGTPLAIVEAKFWAGLTDNQPIAYLKRLTRNPTGLLLFVAPEKRFETLWSEVKRRCQESGLKIKKASNPPSDLAVAKIGETHFLAITSWRAVLNVILVAVESAGEMNVASDVQQLFGLCEKMDSDSFLPLRSEELSPQIGQRLMQFCQIIDDVTNRAVNAKLASVDGMRAAAGQGWSGRYMKVHGQGCCLYFDADSWCRLRETPFWFSVQEIKPNYWSYNPALKDALSSLEREIPSRLFVVEDWIAIPFYAPLGAEQDKVVNALFSQFKEVANLLRVYHKRSQR